MLTLANCTLQYNFREERGVKMQGDDQHDPEAGGRFRGRINGSSL
jgi:hypothetical protein